MSARIRILVVQTGFLGDVILTTPLLAALRRRHPTAEITMLVTPAGAPLVAAHPALDRVEVDDKRGRGRGLRGLVALARRLRAGHFDVVVAAHKSVRTALALRAAGIPRRIGFATAPGGRFYTERVPRPLERHDRDRLLGLLAPLGIAAATTAAERPSIGLGVQADRPWTGPEADRPWIGVDAATAVRAAHLLAPLAAERRPFAAICPGSAWRTKRWPAAAFGALVRALEADGYRCLVLGAPDEAALTAAVHHAAGGTGVDLGGQTDLALLAAVMARVAVAVTNDSAPMHVATAAGVPQVAIFCATVPGQGYGPLGSRTVVVERDLACRPCGRHGGTRCPRGTDDCMELVTVDEVRAAVARVRARAA